MNRTIFSESPVVCVCVCVCGNTVDISNISVTTSSSRLCSQRQLWFTGQRLPLWILKPVLCRWFPECKNKHKDGSEVLEGKKKKLSDIVAAKMCWLIKLFGDIWTFERLTDLILINQWKHTVVITEETLNIRQSDRITKEMHTHAAVLPIRVSFLMELDLMAAYLKYDNTLTTEHDTQLVKYDLYHESNQD